MKNRPGMWNSTVHSVAIFKKSGFHCKAGFTSGWFLKHIRISGAKLSDKENQLFDCFCHAEKKSTALD